MIIHRFNVDRSVLLVILQCKMSGKGHSNKAICEGSLLHFDAERETLVICAGLLPLFKEAEWAQNRVWTAA